MTDRSRLRIEELQQQYERLTETFVRAGDTPTAAAVLDQLLRISERIGELRRAAATKPAHTEAAPEIAPEPSAEPKEGEAQDARGSAHRPAAASPKASPPRPERINAAVPANTETIQGTVPSADIGDIYTPAIRQWMKRQLGRPAGATTQAEPTASAGGRKAGDAPVPQTDEIQSELLRSFLQRLDEQGRLLLRIDRRLDAISREPDLARQIGEVRAVLDRQREHVVTLARALEHLILRLAREPAPKQQQEP